MKLDRKQIEADFRTLIGPLCDLSLIHICRYRSTESVSEIKKRSGAWGSGMPDSLFCFNNLKTKDEIA